MLCSHSMGNWICMWKYFTRLCTFCIWKQFRKIFLGKRIGMTRGTACLCAANQLQRCREMGCVWKIRKNTQNENAFNLLDGLEPCGSSRFACSSRILQSVEFFRRIETSGSLHRKMNALVYLMLGIWIYEYTKSRQPPSPPVHCAGVLGVRFLMHSFGEHAVRSTCENTRVICKWVPEYKNITRLNTHTKTPTRNENISFIRSFGSFSRRCVFFPFSCVIRNKWDNSVAIADLHHSQLFGVLSIWHVWLFSVTVQWQ